MGGATLGIARPRGNDGGASRARRHRGCGVRIGDPPDGDTATSGGVFRPVLTLWSQHAERAIGSLEAAVPGSAIVRATGATGGTTLAAFDRRTGLPLLTTPFDPDLASKPTFNWNGERWLVARRTLEEPAIEIVAAAPVADYEAPFADAARRGLVALLVVAAL